MKLSITIVMTIGALLLAWNMAIADGIYVTKDKRHVAGKHQVVKLTKDQIIDVETRRNLVLTKEQHRMLTRIGSKFPRKLRILSSRWDDCTCGMPAYGIWCRVGEVDIPTNLIQRYVRGKTSDEVGDYDPSEHSNGLDLIMDSKGTMSLNGKMVTQKEIEALANKQKHSSGPTEKMQVYISVDTPPPVNKTVDQEILNSLKALASFAERNSMSFHASGYRFGQEDTD